MRLVLFILITNVLAVCGSDTGIFTDNYIGMNKNQIVTTLKVNHRPLRLNNAVINNSYNYLKFEDRINEITALFFLNDNDKCRMVRIMSSYSNIKDLKTHLNNAYKPAGNNNWKYEHENINYTVELTEGDWFFTISIKKEQE